MSVIMRNISGGGSGSSSKGFPPGDVTNIYIVSGNKYVKLKWTDPNTSVYNGSTLSTWSSTIIVRKEGSAPTSIKDGTVVLTNTTKNKYSSTPYTDSNVTVGKTYYYRFYTLSTDKVYNDSTSMIYAIKVLAADPVLKNNTWEQIASISESGVASSLWKVGDEIDLTLSGSFNETVTLQIWDFNHFVKSDGSGKAGICFGMKNLMENKQYMNTSNANSGGWNNTAMKKIVMINIYNSMPTDLQNVIKEVNTYANIGGGSTSSNAGKLSKDIVFLPGSTEVNNNDWPYQNPTETNQKKFPIFTDNNSRIKKMNNGSGDASMWWTRSPYYGNGADGFFAVNYNGGPTPDGSSTSNGVCFCFNI